MWPQSNFQNPESEPDSTLSSHLQTWFCLHGLSCEGSFSVRTTFGSTCVFWLLGFLSPWILIPQSFLGVVLMFLRNIGHISCLGLPGVLWLLNSDCDTVAHTLLKPHGELFCASQEEHTPSSQARCLWFLVHQLQIFFSLYWVSMILFVISISL